MKKLLAVFAHPDDEAFGPGATLAKYAYQGIEIHLLLATKGEAGDNYLRIKKSKTLGEIREKEARKSAKILGIKKIKFLGFQDGELKQNDYHKLAQKVIAEIKSFKPETIITYEPLGISGHLDHIAVSLTTTYAYLKARSLAKLYYYCLPDFLRSKRLDNYFIYFPEGYSKEQITTRIDVSKFWSIKVKAMFAHKSQLKDVKEILKERENLPKVDNFILKYPQGKAKFSESDL